MLAAETAPNFTRPLICDGFGWDWALLYCIVSMVFEVKYVLPYRRSMRP
jgi:hypothetical protein